MAAVPTSSSQTWRERFPRTIERFTAWWNHEVLDRPPLTVNVKSPRAYSGPVSHHAHVRDKWLDAAFRVAEMIARVECTEYACDSFPIVMPNSGPELIATLFGCELEYSQDSAATSWSVPIVEDPQRDWPTIIAREPDFAGSPWWRLIEDATRLAIEQCDGRYVVGFTDIHDAFDTLAALRDPQELCLDFMDCPDLVEQAADHMLDAVIETHNRSYDLLESAGFGSTSWIPAYWPGRSNISCCDFWALLSDEQANRIVLPRIVRQIDAAEKSIFHLDGPQALRHLSLLLDLPRLAAVQWVYGAGAGPVTRWVDVYRRIQAAGKSAQVYCDTPEHAMAILEALGPRGMWFCIGMPFETHADVQAFEAQVERVTRQWRASA